MAAISLTRRDKMSLPDVLPEREHREPELFANNLRQESGAERKRGPSAGQSSLRYRFGRTPSRGPGGD